MTNPISMQPQGLIDWKAAEEEARRLHPDLDDLVSKASQLGEAMLAGLQAKLHELYPEEEASIPQLVLVSAFEGILRAIDGISPGLLGTLVEGIIIQQIDQHMAAAALVEEAKAAGPAN